MAPKEKAEKLVKEFANFSKGNTVEQNKNSAVQCALITVEEIIASIQPAQYRLWNHNEMMTEFWDEVKQEIEKM